MPNRTIAQTGKVRSAAKKKPTRIRAQRSRDHSQIGGESECIQYSEALTPAEAENQE